MTEFPKTLALPSKQGYTINPQSGVIKTQMTTGPARQRRITKSPITEIPVEWNNMSLSDFGIFEAWVLHEAKMGAEWFNIKLLSGLGLIPHTARFKGDQTPYSVKLDSKTNLCNISATLEVLSRPTLSEGALRLLLVYGFDDLITAEALMTNTVDEFCNNL